MLISYSLAIYKIQIENGIEVGQPVYGNLWTEPITFSNEVTASLAISKGFILSAIM
ncbi:MAG: hypothetical protein HUJ96_06480 [Marinilabiliaceae bacterium]|nr:hypothetical protein [Marinilabiliaceae bacterium]